jgi:hypothetical protein
MQYYLIEPEVAGGFGENTVISRPNGKMIVERLHYEFQGWLGDPLLESVPCYIITTELASKMTASGLTGFSVDKVEVSESDDFGLIQPDTVLPKFVWLKINGIAEEDDIALSDNLELVVSERALDMLQKSGMTHAEIVSYP